MPARYPSAGMKNRVFTEMHSSRPAWRATDPLGFPRDGSHASGGGNEPDGGGQSKTPPEAMLTGPQSKTGRPRARGTGRPPPSALSPEPARLRHRAPPGLAPPSELPEQQSRRAPSVATPRSSIPERWLRDASGAAPLSGITAGTASARGPPSEIETDSDGAGEHLSLAQIPLRPEIYGQRDGLDGLGRPERRPDLPYSRSPAEGRPPYGHPVHGGRHLPSASRS
jgi:hypothetical protein